MLVLKFGGTLVGSAHNINQVIGTLGHKAKQDRIICIVSAVGGITDKLLNTGTLAQIKTKPIYLFLRKLKQFI